MPDLPAEDTKNKVQHEKWAQYYDQYEVKNIPLAIISFVSLEETI